MEQDSIARQQVEAQAALVKQLEGTLQADRAQVATAQLANLGLHAGEGADQRRTGLRQVDAGNMVRASDTNGIVIITGCSRSPPCLRCRRRCCLPVLTRLNAKTAEERLKVLAIDRGRTVLDTGEPWRSTTRSMPRRARSSWKRCSRTSPTVCFRTSSSPPNLRLEQLEGALTVPQSAVQRGTPGTLCLRGDAREDGQSAQGTARCRVG